MICLQDVMDRSEGWGRVQGRAVFQRLLSAVEDHPGVEIFRISFKGVNRIDMSFASETVVELAKRFRQHKGFCFVDLADEDMIENLDAAAARKMQPVFVWSGNMSRLIGPPPSQGVREALEFVLGKPQVRSSEFAETRAGMTIQNASMKFKSLWESGYVMRRESAADTGGVEFVYSRIQ